VSTTKTRRTKKTSTADGDVKKVPRKKKKATTTSTSSTTSSTTTTTNAYLGDMLKSFPDDVLAFARGDDTKGRDS
jgi:hypothetical protein